jgi:competence ComEA-like helix-hairpin-helix protein
VPTVRTRYLAGMQPSIARGLAWVAVVALAVVLARAALMTLADAPSGRASVCEVPVELVTARGVRLACATEPVLRSCTDLRAGDRVSSSCQVDPGAMAAVTRLLVGVPIDINRASAADLELLDGIGPKLADAIVSARTLAPFERVDDLERVRGIGPAKMNAMRPFVGVASPE